MLPVLGNSDLPMRKVLIDLTGQQFGEWTVLERRGTAHGKALWLVRCRCGQEKTIHGNSLRRGVSRSCGCLMRRLAAEAHRKHGHTVGHDATREYRAWQAMK